MIPHEVTGFVLYTGVADDGCVRRPPVDAADEGLRPAVEGRDFCPVEGRDVPAAVDFEATELGRSLPTGPSLAGVMWQFSVWSRPPTDVRRTSVGRPSDIRPSDVRRTCVGRRTSAGRQPDVRRTSVGRLKRL